MTTRFDISSKLATLAAPLTRPWAAGGAILMLHSIAEPPAGPRVGWAADIETPMRLLEEFIGVARYRGYEFVPLDELHRRLITGRSTARCMVVTFDDGYADVYTRAYPFLERENVPFTVYLTTGFLDHKVVPWWYLAERQLAGRHGSEREGAFAEIAHAFEASTPAEARPLANRLFGEAAVRAACAEFAMTWGQAEDLARDPLVTIGAHTVTHRNLKRLTDEELRWELTESRRVLEQRFSRRIDHLAYPFGSRLQAGPREFAMAKACEFKTAVTTRQAPVYAGHVDHLEALPRVFADSARELDAQLSGAVSLLRYRKRVVADG